jgi:hypothetical protein
MQILRVFAKLADDSQFDVFWSNTELKTVRGIVHVTVPMGEDRAVIAELHTLQYLLEEVEAIGRNAAGSDKTTLVVSSGAIKKLARKASDKQSLAIHAKFLLTRFSGCQIEVEKKSEWTETLPNNIDTVSLDASTPHEETIIVHGLGEVVVTAHVVEQFAERFFEQNNIEYTLSEAWRQLRKIAGDSALKEVDRSNPNMRIKYAMQGRTEGRYFMHPYKKWIFVCTKHVQQTKMALVTAYTLPEG